MARSMRSPARLLGRTVRVSTIHFISVTSIGIDASPLRSGDASMPILVTLMKWIVLTRTVLPSKRAGLLILLAIAVSVVGGGAVGHARVSETDYPTDGAPSAVPLPILVCAQDSDWM